MKKFSIRIMAEIAIFAALGIIINFLESLIPQPIWASGGVIGISMCAVFMLAYRYGLWAMITGLLIGLFSMLEGIYISPFAENWYGVFFQLFLDYFGAWMVVGFAGLFARLVRNSKTKFKRGLYVGLGCFLGGFLKFLMHFASGMLFWPSDDINGQFVYSLVYNGGYMLPSTILCAIIMIAIIVSRPFLVFPEKGNSSIEEEC